MAKKKKLKKYGDGGKTYDWSTSSPGGDISIVNPQRSGEQSIKQSKLSDPESLDAQLAYGHTGKPYEGIATGKTEPMLGLDDPILGAITLAPLAKTLTGLVYKGYRQMGQDILSSKLGNKVVDKFTKGAQAELEEGTDFLRKWYKNPEIKDRFKALNPNDAKVYPENAVKIKTSYGEDYVTMSSDGIKLARGANKEPYRALVSKLETPKLSLKQEELGDLFNIKGVHKGGTGKTFVNKLATNKSSIAAHEGTHQIFGRGYTEAESDLLRSAFRTPKSQYEGYLYKPYEIHARINEARHNLGLNPTDLFTESMITKIPKNTPGTKELLGMIKDKGEFVNLMNKFYTPAAAVGASTLFTNDENMKTKKLTPSFKKGGKMAYCKDGGEIDFTYIFSKELGTADKTQKVMKDLGGRMPSDYLHVVSGPDHPANGSQGGAQFDSSMRPIDNSTLKFNEAKGKKPIGTTATQPGAVAFLENGETFINPKYKKGILPYGVDPIARNTADRLFTSIEAENEQLRTKGQKNMPMQFGWGGYAADQAIGAANEVSGVQAEGEGNGLGIATDVINGVTGAATGFAGMAGQMKADSEDLTVSTKTKRLNAASSGLAASAAAIQAVPVVGQIGGAVLGLASGLTKVFAGKSAKQDKWKEDYSNQPLAVTQNTAGNQMQGYAKGGKMPMYGDGTPWWIDETTGQELRRTGPDKGGYFDSSFYPTPYNQNPAYLDDRLARREINELRDPKESTAPFKSKMNGNLKTSTLINNVGGFNAMDFSGTSDADFQSTIGPNKDSPAYTPTPQMIGDENYPPFTKRQGNKNARGINKEANAARNSSIPSDQFGLTTGDKLMLGSMLPATLFNAANFAAGYDKEKAILNPEANKIKSLMDQKIDFQAMLNESRAERNRTEGFINRSTDNQAVRRSNLLQSASNSARANSGINLQGQMAQNQLDTSRAQMLDQLGRETMQAKETARELTARNKGTWQGFGAAMSENIGEGLSRTGTAMNTREMNNLKLGILNSLPGNYSTSKEKIKKIMDGMTDEELIMFKQMLPS